MTSSIHKIAMIGTGMVAGTHLQAIAELPEKIQLVGVLANRAESAATFAAKASTRCGYPVSTYESLEALCSDSSLDWVLVITPPNARTDIVSALASAKLPILMEKPVERSAQRASELVLQCEQSKVPLGIVFQHRMREASVKLASLISDDALGDLVIAEARIPWWREQSYYDEPGRGSYERDGGGVLISQAIHTLDLLISLTGPVARVSAMAHTTSLHTMESEDYVSAALRFQCGAVGSLVASTASFPGEAESLSLHFSRCVAHLQSGVLTLSWRDGRTETFGANATTGGGADPMAFTHEWHGSIIKDFDNALREGRAPCATGRDALQVHALIDALVQSSKQGSVVSVQHDWV